jgi:hypothetical protein
LQLLLLLDTADGMHAAPAGLIDLTLRRAAIDRLTAEGAAEPSTADDWVRFTAAPAAPHPAAPPQQEVSAATAVQASPWRRRSDAAMHSAKAAWGHAAPSQASPASGAWPVAAAKMAWGQAPPPHIASGSAAMQSPPHRCAATQRHPQRPPVRRSLAGALTPAAAWERLCQRTPRPSAAPHDALVWVAGESSSSDEDVNGDVVQSDDDEVEAAAPSCNEAVGLKAEASRRLPSGSTALGKRQASALAVTTPSSSSSRRHLRAAAPLPAQPARILSCQVGPWPVAKLRRSQMAGRHDTVPAAEQADEDVDTDNSSDAEHASACEAESAPRCSPSPGSSAGGASMKCEAASGFPHACSEAMEAAQYLAFQAGRSQRWQSVNGRQTAKALLRVPCRPAWRQARMM